MIDRDRRVGQYADNHRPGRRQRRRWAGVLLVLAGLAAVLAVLLARSDPTPTAGPPLGRPTTATPSSRDEAALPAEVLLYAATGTSKGTTRTWDIWVADPDGTGRRNLTRDAAQDDDPAWSPDRRRIVYASMPSRCQGSGCQADLYVIGRDGRNRTRLTNTPQDERGPDWSPDGGRIAYTRSDKGRSGIWVMAAEGSGQRQLTGGGFAPDWAPDATRILYVGGDYRPHTVNADGTGRRRIGSFGPIRSARWSPDGARIALSMADAVWIVNADGGGLRKVRQSAAYPFWTPDGRHLVFTAYGSGTTPPQLRRIDADGRNEIQLRP